MTRERRWTRTCIGRPADPFDIGVTTSTALDAARNGRTREERLRRARTVGASGQPGQRVDDAHQPARNLRCRGRRSCAWAREEQRIDAPDPVCRRSVRRFRARDHCAALSGTDSGTCLTARAGGKPAWRNAAVTGALEEAAVAPPPADGQAPSRAGCCSPLQHDFIACCTPVSFSKRRSWKQSRARRHGHNACISAAHWLGAVHGADRSPRGWRRRSLPARPVKEANARATSHGFLPWMPANSPTSAARWIGDSKRA